MSFFPFVYSLLMSSTINENPPEITPPSISTGTGSIPIKSILQQPDGAIKANLLFSISISILLFIIYCFFKSRLKGIYTPNLIGKRRKSLPMVKAGYFSWIWTVLTLSDDNLLPLIGLDAYVFVQSLKMLFLVMCCLVLPAMILLVPTFLMGSMENMTQWYFKMSILNVKDSNWILWFPFLNCLIIEVLVYYVIYVIYRNYVVLRQAFLRSPSTFHALNRFMELSEILGSKERTKRLLNLMTKTVLLTGISAKYKESDIINLLQSTDIGKVSFVFKIKTREEMIFLLEKRNSCIVDLEIRLCNFYDRMMANLKKENSEINANNANNANFTDGNNNSNNANNASNTLNVTMNAWLNSLEKSSPNITMIEKCRLMRELIENPSMFTEFRTVHVTKDGTPMDSIVHYFGKLQLLEQELNDHLQEFTTFNHESNNDNTNDTNDNNSSINNDINETRNDNIHPHSIFSNTLTIPSLDSKSNRNNSRERDSKRQSKDTDNLSISSISTEITSEEMSLVSIKGLSKIPHNIKDIKLTLYGTSESAIVIFDHPRSASIASQSLLSFRPFSFVARHAPGPSDLLWENLLIPPSEIFVRKSLSNVLYIFTNIVFFSIVAGLGKVLDIEFLQGIFPFLIPIFSKSATLKNIIEGILAPLSYNLLLLGSPYLIQAMIKYQGTISKSELQCQLMRKYAWFLSIQSFLSVIVSRDLSDLLDGIIKGQYQDLLIFIKATMPQRSPFFFNLVIQKATIGMMIQLAKPGRLFMAAIHRIRHAHWTPRNIQESRRPDKARLGFMYPDYLIIIFQITLAFMSLTPLSVLAGLLFYGIACFTFRALFIYTIKVQNESGGVFWRRLATQLMIAVVLNHFFTLIQLVFKEATYQAVLLSPFFFSSIILMYYFDDFFSKRINNSSLLVEGGDRLAIFIDKIDLKRDEMMAKSSMTPLGNSRFSPKDHNDQDEDVEEDNDENENEFENERIGNRENNERNFSDTTISTDDQRGENEIDSIERNDQNDPKITRESSCPNTTSGTKKYTRLYDSVPCDLGADIETNLFDSTSEAIEFREMSRSVSLHHVEPLTNPYCNPILFKKFTRIMLPPHFFTVLKKISKQ